MKNAAEKPIPSSHAFSKAPAEEPLKSFEDSFETSSGLLSRLWRWLCSLQVGRAGERRLRVADTVSLGEKRFVAVVQVDGRHFLLAGGPTNIALLAQLNEKDDFGDVLKKTMTVPNTPVQPPPQLQQEQQQPEPKRASRAKRAAAPARAKKVTQPKKVTSAGLKKQPALAAKRSSKAAAPQSRFGDIPATHQGVRAFEKWLGRAVPIPAAHPAPAKAEPSALREPSTEKVNAPVPLPVKQTLNEWLQEARPASDKQTVKSIAEPIGQSSVEEYA